MTIELIGEAAEWLDRELLENAAAAVLHYFRVEQQRESISVVEFSEALENVLSGLGLNLKTKAAPDAPDAPDAPVSRGPVVETDLCVLAGEGGELFFFPRLREEVRRGLDATALVLRFHGLRACVRHLTGAKRWTPQCRALNDQIVDYLRSCFTQEKAGPGSSLVVH